MDCESEVQQKKLSLLVLYNLYRDLLNPIAAVV